MSDDDFSFSPKTITTEGWLLTSEITLCATFSEFYNLKTLGLKNDIPPVLLGINKIFEKIELFGMEVEPNFRSCKEY